VGTPLPVVPRPLKIALVGFASNTRDLAPYGDTSWEIWGLNNLWKYLPRYDRWFEIHDPKQLEGLYGAEYVEFLKNTTKPVYMQKHFDEYPSSVEIPKADLEKRVMNGRPFWPSSISFMLALAIDMLSDENGKALEGAELGVYGIDLIGEDEYSFQREGAGYLIGIAEGRRIKVTVPDPASLLKANYVYGYDAGEYSPDGYDTFLMAQMSQYAKKKEEALSTVHTYDGAFQGFSNALTMYRHHKRGGVLAGNKPAPTTGEAAK